MDNYRRPAANPAAQQSLEGLRPKQTGGADNNGQQPYRRAVLQQLQSRERAAQAAPTNDLAAAKAHYPPLDMALPTAESSYKSSRALGPSRGQQAARKAVRAGAAGLALMLIVGGVIIGQSFLKARSVFKGTAKPAAALQTGLDPSKLKGEGSGRINILLLGVGGGSHDGPNLTDTMMLASIDPVNHKAALVSVPRDLWVTLPGRGSMKLNAAFETGVYNYLGKIDNSNTNFKSISAGFTSVDQTVESVLGVPVDYNVLVDFKAFSQAVDTVGGLTIDAPMALSDPTMAWDNYGSSILAKAGPNIFNGHQVLNYVRSRETSSDFARSQRQRAVLLALAAKAESAGVVANPAKLTGLIGAFGNNVQTDLGMSDAWRIYSVFKKIPANNIGTLSLAGSTNIDSNAPGAGSLVTDGMINGQSIVMPKAGLGDYSDIQSFVRQNLPDGYLVKEHAKVGIINASSRDGLATAQAAKLKSLGYSVVWVSQTTGYSGSSQVIGLSGNRYKYTRHYLEQRFSTTAQNQLPAGVGSPTGADFVVLLSQDETSPH